MCSVLLYVDGTIQCLDKTTPEDFKAWEFNDSYAQCLNSNNIIASQMMNVSNLNTACEMWTSLEAVHESQGHQYAIALMRSLFHTITDEGDDIVEHLNKLKEAWEKLNMLDNENFFIPDTQFKALLTSPLPPSWDTLQIPMLQAKLVSQLL